MYPFGSVMRVMRREHSFAAEPFLIRALRSPHMHDLDKVVEMLKGNREDVAEAIEFLSSYRVSVCSFVKCRQGLTGNLLALTWSASVEKLVELVRKRDVPDTWYRPRVKIDTVEYALRQCALLVTESPTTTDVEALVAVGQIFLQHGFQWSKLSPNDRDRIVQTVTQCVESFDENQQIVWKTFVAGFPRTRSSLPFLQRLLIETQGLSLTEAEIHRSLADVRDRIRRDLQLALTSLEVKL